MSSILIILAAVEWLCKADATASNAVWTPMQHNDPPDGGRLGSTTFLTDLYDPDLSSPPWVSVHSTTASRSLTSSDGSSPIATEANTTAVVQYTSPGVICWGDMHGTEPPNLPSVRVMRAGHRSVCAITETGYAVCWGQHIQNVEVPSDLGLVRDIMPYGYASFDTGVCAITEEVGTLRCWGVVPFDIPEDIPDNLTQLVFYRTPRGVGPISCCVLEGSGNVTCFGNGAVAPPDDLGPVRQLASWRGTVCAATEAGMVRCWNDELSPGWTWTGGAARSIAIASAGRTSVCANLEAGYIECVPNPGLPPYAQIPGLHLELVAGDSFWAGLDVKNNVLALWGAFPPSLRDHQPGFLTTRLAVAANADYICTYSHFDTVATLELSSCGETASVQSSASLRSLIPSVTEPNVPYRFCAPTNGTYILETCSSDVRTKIYLPTVDKQYIGWSKGDTGDAIPDNPCPASGEAARVNLTAGECVAGYLGYHKLGMHNLSVHCSESALTDIAEEMASSTVCFGASMSGLEPPKDLPPVQLIRGGYRDMCAILETGNATCWGLHAANLSVPGDLGLVVDILPFGRDPLEAGACAITKGAGRLRCWGAVPFDIPVDLPSNLTQVVIHRPTPHFISSTGTFGPMSCCVLEASGNVTCFGNHSTPPPADVGGVVQLTTWKDVVCAISQEGRIWCWNTAGFTNSHPVLAARYRWEWTLGDILRSFTERRIAASAHGWWGSLCAVTEAGVVQCIPDGTSGLSPGAGNPNPDDLYSLARQYDAMDIVSGHNFWCVWRVHKEKPEGQIRCWTATTEGWLPVVPITRPLNTELAAGEDFFCAYSVPPGHMPTWDQSRRPVPAPGPPPSETTERIEVCNIKRENTCRGSKEILTKEVSLPLFQDLCGYHRFGMVVEPGACKNAKAWSGVDVQPVDWNGDGLMDLVIRVDADEPRYLERVSRSHLEERFGAENPFAGIRHPGLEGPTTSFSRVDCKTSNPAGFTVTDWDGDGDLDLVVGARDHGLHYHENDGTGKLVEVPRQNGPFANLTIGMYYTAMDEGLNSKTPGISKRLQAVDWDGDGDLDLVVYWASAGDPAPTAVRYYERQGLWGPLIPTSTSQFPLLFMAPVFSNDEAVTTPLSKFGAAVLADWDQDGDVDAIVVDAADDVRFYRRLSDRSTVKTLGEQHPLGSFKSLGVAVHTTRLAFTGEDRFTVAYDNQHERRLPTRFLHVTDWYGDGLPDIMAFDCEQTVILSRTAEESFHELTNQHSPLGNLQVLDDSQPQFIDFNGDNFTDIISWSSTESKDINTASESPLNYFEGRPDGSFRAVSADDPNESPFYGLFWQPGGGKQFLFDHSRDTMVFAVDWNDDGQVDLLFRNYTSELELFTALAPGRLSKKGSLLGHLGVPHHSIQCFQAIDWDGDSEMEVLAIVTGRDSRTVNQFTAGLIFAVLVWDFFPGPLMLYKPAGEEGFFSDENSTAITDAGEVPLPAATSFHAVDFDRDGDLDLLLYTGSELLYYERDSRGLTLRPDHPLGAVDVQIDSTSVHSKDLKLRAFDIDGDGALELVSGSASSPAISTWTMRVWRQGSCDPPSACNQAGVCSPFTGKCLCLGGRTLSDCSGCSASYYSSTESVIGEVPMCLRCPADGNGNVCYQHGVCHDDHLAKTEAPTPQARVEARGTGNCRCSPGFYGNDTDGLSTCKDGGCPVGAELGPLRVDGSRACQPCAEGRGKDTAGLEACTACPPGRFAQAGRCALCDPGRFSGETGAVSSVSCRPCPPGTFNNASGSDSTLACQACPVGAATVSEGQTTASSCLQPWQAELVGSLLLPSFNCTAGRSCSLRLQGNLGGPHRLAIFHNCSTRDPVAGVPNEGVSQVADEQGHLYRWTGALQSYGGSYELCWCAGMQGLTSSASCSTPSAFQIRAGQLILQGPYSKLKGELLAVRTPRTTRLGPIRGEDLHSSDHLLIATRCDQTAADVAGAGELNVEASETDMGVELTAVFPSFLPAPGDYWLCWARAVQDGFAAPVGQVTVQGPVDRQSASCAVGQHCVVSGISGVDLQAGDEFMPSMDCVVPLDGLPMGGIYTAGMPGSEAGSFEVGAAGIPMIIRTSTYRLCWRRLPHSWVSFGLFSATGPQGDLQATCTLGRTCLLSDEAGQPLRGVGLAVGDSLLIVAGSCGAVETLDAFGFPAWKLPRSSTTGERGTFDFGYLPLDGTPGVYEACWCPSGSSCSSPSDFLATAGQVQVHCPPGTYAIGAEGRKVCAECPRGAQCPGGLPDDAVSISCPEGSTSSPGASNSSSCVCRSGFRFLETQQECQECPVGRYKSSVANAGTCSPCPGELTTFGLGSTSSSSCIEVQQGSHNESQAPVRQADNSTEVWVVGMRLSLQGLTTSQLDGNGWAQLQAKIRSAVARQTQSALAQVHVAKATVASASDRRLDATQPLTKLQVKVNTRSQEAADLATADLGARGFLLEVAAATGIAGGVQVSSAPHITRAPVLCRAFMSVPPGVAIISPDECHCAEGAEYEPTTATCRLCPRGQYKVSVGNVACERCAASQTTLAEGATSLASCVCEAGTSAAQLADGQGDIVCEGCPPGFYCDGTGAGDGGKQSCPARSDTVVGGRARALPDCQCNAGHYPDEETGSCEPCKAGTYKPGLGNGLCQLSCPQGATSNPGARSNFDCYCLPGSFASVGDDGTLLACVACPPFGLDCRGGFEQGAAAGSSSRRLLAEDRPIHAMPVAKAGYFQTGVSTAVLCKISDNGGRSQCQGGMGCVALRTNGTTLKESLPQCYGEYGSACAVGSGGMLCGNCPAGFARHTYPKTCTRCSGNVYLGVVGSILAEILFQASFILFLTALAAQSSASKSLHSAVIRSGSQWLAACSVIAFFDLQDIKGFSWAQEEADIMAKSGQEPVGGPLALFQWPAVLSDYLQNLFAFAGLFPTIASVQEQLECLAEEVYGTAEARMLVPALYHLVYPLLVMFSCLVVCAAFVYLGVPICLKLGVKIVPDIETETVRRTRLKSKRASTQVQLDEVSQKLTAWGVQRCQLEESVVGGLDLAELEGHMEDCISAMKALFPHERSIAAQMFLTRFWDSLEAPMRKHGINREHLTEYVQHTAELEEFKQQIENALRNPTALADEVNAVPRPLLTSSMSLKRSLVRPTSTSSTLEAREMGYILGLFTRSPAPRTLLLQCTPVLWLSINNMWPYLLQTYLKMVWCQPILIETPARQLKQEQRLIPFPDIQCGSDSHWPVQLCAIVGLSLWCVGGPTALFFRVRAFGNQKYSPEATRMFGYILEGYEPQWWWWDIVIKRIDVGLMMVATYTSLALDDKAKLMLYPAISNAALVVNALARPLDNRQAGLLDYIEGTALAVRCALFSIIAVLLTLNTGMAANGIAGGALAIWVTLFLITVLVHTFAQYMRKFTDLDAEERQQLEQGEQAQQTVPSESSRSTVAKIKTQAGKVTAALHRQRRSWMQGELEVCWADITGAEAILAKPDSEAGNGRCKRVLAHLRDLFLRRTERHQREALAHAFSEFHKLWLTHFSMVNIEFDFRIIFVLTLASKVVSTKTKSKHVLPLWMRAAEDIAMEVTKKQRKGTPFSADDVCIMTERFRELNSEEAEELNSVVKRMLGHSTYRVLGQRSTRSTQATLAAPTTPPITRNLSTSEVMDAEGSRFSSQHLRSDEAHDEATATSGKRTALLQSL